MNKNKYSQKAEDKHLIQKNLRELQKDDYVDRLEHVEISESDILAVPLSESYEETRDAGALKSLSRVEHEESLRLRKNLESYSLNGLKIAAAEAGIEISGKLNHSELIEKIVKELVEART